MEPTLYVLGFMFDPDRDNVLLIEKNRPAWQAGCFNGIGGKVNPGEVPSLSIIREFKEETGIDHGQWEPFLNLEGPGFFVACFRAFSDNIFKATSTTDESVSIVRIDSLPWNVIPNLKWIIPLALDSDVYFGDVHEKAHSGVDQAAVAA